MKCEKCGKEFNTGKFCPECGGALVKEKAKFKLSVITIISIIALVLVSIPFIWSIGSATAEGSETSGWIVLIAGVAGFFVIGYYLSVFFISIICDLAIRKSNNIVQTILIAIFLVIPLILVLTTNIIHSVNEHKVNYTFKDVSVSFPKEMEKYYFNSGYYSLNDDIVEFKKDKCHIAFGSGDYNSNNSLIENFKHHSDDSIAYYDDTDPNNVTKHKNVEDSFDLNYKLKNESINGKTWGLYEKQYSDIHYKLYGIRIKNNFYKIEVNDKSGTDSTECNDLTKKVINSVKYK